MSYTFYHVRQNDQLYVILRNHYGNAEFLRDRQAVVALVLRNNPKITDVDRIFPGQMIMLPGWDSERRRAMPEEPPQQIVESCAVLSGGLSRLDAVTKDFMSRIDFRRFAVEAGTGFVDVVGDALESAVPDIKRIALEYYRKEAGTTTSNQYKYQRAKAIKRIEYKIGPLQRLINPTKTTGEVLRIQRHDAVRTSAILREAEKLDRIARLAKRGVVVLKAASIAETGMKIHLADSNQERTTLLLDEASGAVGGAATAVVAVLVFGTPVGWVAIAGMAVVTAAGAYGMEQLGKRIQEKLLYDANGRRIETDMDRMWSKIY